MEGTINKLKPEGPYGFIYSQNNQSYFFHREDYIGFWEDLVKDFRTNPIIKVVFDDAKTEKGLRARNVRRLDFPNQAV